MAGTTVTPFGSWLIVSPGVHTSATLNVQHSYNIILNFFLSKIDRQNVDVLNGLILVTVATVERCVFGLCVYSCIVATFVNYVPLCTNDESVLCN